MSAKACCRQQEVCGSGGRMWSRLMIKKPMLLAYWGKRQPPDSVGHLKYNCVK
jgi:hypothetical protein